MLESLLNWLMRWVVQNTVTPAIFQLYTEDAVVEFFHAGPIATGHAQILAILENRTDIITEVSFLGLPLKDKFVLKVTGLAIQNVVDNSTFDVGFVSLMVERDNGTVFHHYQTDQAIVDGKIVYERSRRL